MKESSERGSDIQLRNRKKLYSNDVTIYYDCVTLISRVTSPKNACLGADFIGDGRGLLYL